jgi:hypothetical protein
MSRISTPSIRAAALSLATRVSRLETVLTLLPFQSGE